MSGPENKFRRKFTEMLIAHLQNVYVQKNHGSEFSAGLTDLEVVYRSAVAFLELKASKLPKRDTSVHINWSNLSALQRGTLEAIDLAGGNAGVLWLLDSGARGFKGSLLVRVDASVACVAQREGRVWTGSEDLWSGFRGLFCSVSGFSACLTSGALVAEFPPPPKADVVTYLDRVVFG